MTLLLYCFIGSSINSIVRTNISSSSNYKATYTCQEGYMLTQGDRVRTCGVLGDWRGRQPLCRCNKYKICDMFIACDNKEFIVAFQNNS